MKLIEKNIEGKIDLESCEDNIFFGKNYVAVIDGATSCNNLKIEGKCGGKFLSDYIRDVLGDLDKLSPLSSEELVSSIDEKIREAYQFYNIDDSKKLKIPAASIVIFNKNKNELAFVGDCQAMTIDDTGFEKIYNNDKRVDELTSSVRSFFIQSMIANNENVNFNSKEEDKGRGYIAELIKRQRVFENTKGYEYSYSVINGYTADVKIRKLPKNVSYIVLASDGYPELKSNLSHTERALREIIEEDSLLIKRYKSTKGFYNTSNGFDDRAYLKIKI